MGKRKKTAVLNAMRHVSSLNNRGNGTNGFQRKLFPMSTPTLPYAPCSMRYALRAQHEINS